MSILVRVWRNGKLVNEVAATSKYDAKQRRNRLCNVYPDCIITIGDTDEATKTSEQAAADRSSTRI